MPEEWLISQICESFQCLPSQAVRELEVADADLVFTILEMRSYANAKRVVDRAESQSDLDASNPAIRRVLEIEAEAMRLEHAGEPTD